MAGLGVLVVVWLWVTGARVSGSSGVGTRLREKQTQNALISYDVGGGDAQIQAC